MCVGTCTHTSPEGPVYVPMSVHMLAHVCHLVCEHTVCQVVPPGGVYVHACPGGSYLLCDKGFPAKPGAQQQP